MRTMFLKNFIKQNLRNPNGTCRRDYQTFPEYKDLIRAFNNTFPDMKKFLLSKMEPKTNLTKTVPQSAIRIVDEMLTHQLGAGRQTRPALVLKTHEAMTSGYSSEIEREGFQRIHVMAWISDILHGGAIFSDDIVDGSEMRRSEIPWYRKRGAVAAADLTVLHMCAFVLLNEWFGNDVFFNSATKLLTKHTLEITTVQLWEHETHGWLETNNLTWDKYHHYCTRKAGYATDLPFKMAAYESTRQDLQFTDLIDEILLDLSILLQLGNDSECILPPLEHLNFGKDLDEDLKIKKINFANVYLLNEAANEDINLMKENFGKDDPQCIKEVRNLYDKYDLPSALKTYMENFDKSIVAKIEKVSNEHRIRDGLIAALKCVRKYPESSPGTKNLYPK